MWGAPLCWLSHIQQCCCGCKTASGISMYKQAYKWSTIWLFIFILLTVNKAEQALTPSNKWRPTHTKSAAAGNRGGLFELRSILFRLRWSWAVFFNFIFAFCLLSFSARQIMYSCIPKSDVMNVTVFACVVLFLWWRVCVCVFGVEVGCKGFGTVDSLYSCGFWQRLIGEVYNVLYLNIQRHTVCGSVCSVTQSLKSRVPIFCSVSNHLSFGWGQTGD